MITFVVCGGSEFSVSDEMMRQTFDKIRHGKKRAFLKAYAKTGIVALSAEAVGIDRTTHYVWLRDDPAYAEALEVARDEAIERMETECDRRAVQGWEEPVFHNGEVVGYKRKYSDLLMIFRLKALAPN